MFYSSAIQFQVWSSSFQVFVQELFQGFALYIKKGFLYRDLRRLVTKCVISNNDWLDGDLLGSNPLINKEGQYKITDTGLARVFVITL